MSISKENIYNSNNKEVSEVIEDKYLISYNKLLQYIERLHRQLLDVIKDEFERNGRKEVNSVQAMLLFNIAHEELSPGELKNRGHYLGSNVSYNLKKLVEKGYIAHERSSHDRRSVKISLTKRGKEIHDIVNNLYKHHLEALEKVGEIGRNDIENTSTTLKKLERYWLDQVRFRL